MLQTIRNAWKIVEIRKKILFTLFMILLYRVGNSIPVPYVNVEFLGQYFTSLENTVLGLYNVMSGGAFSSATIFALSIQPYINSSIIIQLLCIAIPALERMAKDEGEEGKKKINDITRYTTVGIALLQGFAYYMLLRNNTASGYPLLSQYGVWEAIVIIMTFTAGSALVMWMGEQITEFGIGNGISIILFASIISRFPTNIITAVTNIINGSLAWWAYLLMLIGALILPRTLRLLRETVDVLLESTPRGLDLDSVRSHLLGVPHVVEVHDLHCTQIATGLPVLTAHVVVQDSCFRDGHAPEMLDALQSCVAEHFPVSIEHSTFQLEPERHALHERGHHD